jgi:hypothetical protein
MVSIVPFYSFYFSNRWTDAFSNHKKKSFNYYFLREASGKVYSLKHDGIHTFKRRIVNIEC